MRCFLDLSLNDLDESWCDKMTNNVLDKLFDVLTVDSQSNKQKMVKVWLQKLS